MWRIDYEEEILREMLPDWDAFLFSNEIYWQLHLTSKEFTPAERRIRISAGRLLISLFLVKHLSENEQDLYLHQLLELKNKWQANWQKKVANELPIRIRQWQHFVEDLRVDTDFSQPQMNNQLQIRLMIALLMDESSVSLREKFSSLVSILDKKYKNMTIDNGFVWDEKLSEIFPPDQFWYLYRKLRQTGRIQ